MYDVLIIYGGNTTKSDDDYELLGRLLDRTSVSMNRVPQIAGGVDLSPEEMVEAAFVMVNKINDYL